MYLKCQLQCQTLFLKSLHLYFDSFHPSSSCRVSVAVGQVFFSPATSCSVALCFTSLSWLPHCEQSDRITTFCYLSNNATRSPVPLLATAKVIQSHVWCQTNDFCDGVQQIWGNLAQRTETLPLPTAMPGTGRRLMGCLPTRRPQGTGRVILSGKLWMKWKLRTLIIILLLNSFLVYNYISFWLLFLSVYLNLL